MSRERMNYLACLVGLTVLLLCVSALAGSFHAEFAGHDEAAYVVSSVMVREFLVGALWRGESPLLFAQQYYAHYPKVAIGHWPPVYFLVEGVLLVITGISRSAIVALSALSSATLALMAVYCCRREGLRWSMAATAGVVVALLPMSLESLVEIGSDVLTAIAMLVAALCCERWLDKPTTRTGVRFGIAMAVAILCKGTAFLLLLLVPFSLLLTRKRVSMWWTPATWMPVVLALMLAVPWYFLADGLLQRDIVPGHNQSLSAEVAPKASKDTIGLVQYTTRLNTLTMLELGGMGLIVLALFSVRSGWYRRSPVLAALPLVTWLFLGVLSPHTEARLFIHLLPVLVFAAAVAANALAPRVQELVLLAALAMAHGGFPVVAEPYDGFVPAVAWILKEPRLGANRILVTSNSSGEGALIGEFALHQPAPLRTIVRATKVLESSTWMGDKRTPLVHSAADVTNILDEHLVDLVVVHESETRPPSSYKPHLDLALGPWQLLRRFDEVRIYQRTQLSSVPAPH